MTENEKWGEILKQLREIRELLNETNKLIVDAEINRALILDDQKLFISKYGDIE